MHCAVMTLYSRVVVDVDRVSFEENPFALLMVAVRVEYRGSLVQRY